MSEIDALLNEDRSFAPTAEWRRDAVIADAGVYERAQADLEGFWAEFAGELEWMRPWDKVLEWQSPHAQWFVGGQINVSANCLDRHVRTARRNKAAFIWEGEPGDRRTLTYWDLYRQVCAFANVLKSLGVKRGDRVAVLALNTTDTLEVQFACGRIGAVFLPLNTRLTVPELQFIVSDSSPKVMIHDTDLAEVALSVAKLCNVSSTLLFGPDGSYEAVIEASEPLDRCEDVTHDDISTIMYTSGTTSRSRPR
jgi:acyl-coenzyme A synthetase/AMP-(fatty) acid ligase